MKHLLNAMLASLTFGTLDLFKSGLRLFLQPAASLCMRGERRGVQGGGVGHARAKGPLWL